LFCEVDERSSTGNEKMLSVSHKTGVTPRSEKNVTMFLAESNVGHKICRPGDIVINTMWAWMAALGVSRHTGLVSPSYGVYRPQSGACGLLPRLADELLRTEAYRADYVRRSTGVNSSRLRLYPEQFLRIPILVPPADEQAAIVKYLGHVDRKINLYVRAKKKLIALLNEQKQAVIHRAVTRGLDPNVKLKPSGVEWLGDVPKHWDVVPFKRRIGLQEGPGIMAEDFRDVGVPLLRISCLHGSSASLNGCNHLDPKMVDRRWSHFRVRAGDYLLSASASTGNVVLAMDDVAGAVPYTGIIRLWPLVESVSMPFVRLWMSAEPFQRQVDAMKSGVGIEHFGPTHLKRMMIALPPLAEQKLIAEFIGEKVEPFTALTENANLQIKNAGEFRTRLIADVVTGKVDVRAAAAKLPNLESEEAARPLGDEELEDINESLDEETTEAAE
jgi:type I restriction enzyme S subunit